jgi:hypothetical protein
MDGRPGIQDGTQTLIFSQVRIIKVRSWRTFFGQEKYLPVKNPNGGIGRVCPRVAQGNPERGRFRR